MQRSFIALLTSTALLTIGAVSLTPTASQAQLITTAQTAPARLIAAATGLAGQFVGADHPTQGGVKVVTENGQRYLEFDAKFSSDNGPDLFVLLHRESNPNDYSKENFVRLGRLQSTSGKQRYAIPADVSVNEFKSVAIWCRAFNVTFGFAPLG